MDIFHITQDDPCFPPALKNHFSDQTPSSIWALGNFDIIGAKPLALFCSAKCTGSIILKTVDTIKQLRDAEVAIASGFHSPLERECLNILLKGRQPIILCPARSIEGMQVKPEIRRPLSDGRLLILSPFGKRRNRISAELAGIRNNFVAALAESVFIPYAAPGSKTEKFYADLINRKKTVYTISDEKTENLRVLGAEIFSMGVFNLNGNH